MLKVGIHDDLIVFATAKNEQGTLIVTVRKAKKVDPLAALNAAGQVSFAPEEQQFVFYSPKLTDFNNMPLSAEQVRDRIKEVKDPLDHILAVYLTVDNRKWDIYAGTGINLENMEQKLTDQGTVNKIYSNIVDQFINMMKPFVGEKGKKVRMLFVRKNKGSHFPRLRTRFLDNHPFIESMEVPASASKLKFDAKYEIPNGLHLPDVVTNQQPVDKKEAAAADALFAPTA